MSNLALKNLRQISDLKGTTICLGTTLNWSETWNMKLKIEIANTYQLKQVCKYITIYIPRTRQMFSSSEKLAIYCKIMGRWTCYFVSPKFFIGHPC